MDCAGAGARHVGDEKNQRRLDRCWARSINRGGVRRGPIPTRLTKPAAISKVS
jgi:hypothetical protein